MTPTQYDSEDGNEARSWLDVLPSHPIFNLPFENLADGNIPLPASPNLSAIGKKTRRPSLSEASDVSQVLDGLDRLQVSPDSTRRSIFTVVRETELVLAVGKELRIASLAEVKSRVSNEAGPSSNIGSYKILHAPEVDFEVVSLVPSLTNPKLLAVVGRSQVAVLVLPRKEWSSLIAGKVDCRTAVLGQYYHGSRSSPIVSVKWHPFGFRGAALCVLTQDAVLREYDLSGDVYETVNTLDFSESTLVKPSHLKSPARSSMSTFSNLHSASMTLADDDEDFEATALCFGSGEGDWGPLTAYCLMNNGSIYAVCPYLPKAASLPVSYLDSLSHFVSFKCDNAPLVDQTMEDATAHISFDSPSLPTNSSYRQLKVRNRLEVQSKYVAALLKQASKAKATESILDEPLASVPLDLPTDHVKIVQTPDLARWSKPRRQGPFLLQPAPVELEGDVESTACDLFYINERRGESYPAIPEDTDSLSLGVILITYTDGKIDVCLELEKLEGRWDTQNEDDLPALLVYESMDLGITSAMTGQQSKLDLAPLLSTNHPIIVPDPIYPDSLYVYHNFGVHSLSISGWAKHLLQELSSGDDATLESFLQKGSRTEVIWVLKTLSLSPSTPSTPVGGLAILKDVYLGYSLLILTTSLQLVGLELSLIPLQNDPPVQTTTSAGQSLPTGQEDQLPSYISLLSKPIFEVPARLDPSSRKANTPRIVMPATSKNKSLDITPDTLRFLGQTVASLRTSVRDLVQAGNAVQNRFELQCKELARQLGKVQDLRTKVETVAKSSSGTRDVKTRLSEVESRQKTLLSRADRILQKLMDDHEPVLSTFETEWFSELNKLKVDVGKESSGKGLQARVDRIQAQLDILGNQVRELDQQPEANDKKRSLMGRNQIARLEAILSEESAMIASARAKISSLNGRLTESVSLMA